MKRILILLILLSTVAEAQLERAGRRVLGRGGLSRASALPYSNSLIPGTTGRATAYFVDSLYGNDSWSGHRSDSAWKSLTKVNAATFVAGDTVYFRRSQTWKNWLFKSNNGAWGSPIVYTSYGYGDKPKIDPSGTSRTYGIYTSGTYNVFDGIEVCNVTGYGIRISGAYGKVVNCVVSQCSEYAVYLNAVSDTVSSCIVNNLTGGSAVGIVADKDSFLISSCTLSAISGAHSINTSGKYGLISDNAVSVPVTDKRGINVTGTYTTISGGSVSGGESGIYINGRHSTVSSVTISGGYSMGVILGSDSCSVYSCSISSVWSGAEYPSGGGFGISMSGLRDTAMYNTVSNCYSGISCAEGSSGCIIGYNVVYHARVNCVNNYATSTTANVAYNNTVVHSTATGTGHGISHQPTSGGAWISKNNLVYSDYTGTDVNTDCYTVGDTTRTNVTTDYNLVYKTPSATLKLFHSNIEWPTLAAWQALCVRRSWTGADAHSIVADPLLVNYTTDFRLQTGSPAIDAGVDVGLTRDILGNPINGVPDIGAYEKQP